MVFGYAMSIVGNAADAEDVMHDAFIRAYQSAVSYQPRGKPLAWLLVIVRNLAYNKIRQRSHTAPLCENEEPKSVAGESGALDRIVVGLAMEILDSEERQIVVLHALAGLKHREIAQILQLPQGTVMSKYHRALGKLRRELEGKGEAK